MSLPEPEKGSERRQEHLHDPRVFLVVEPGELRREVVSVDARRVDPLSMNAVVETLDELADAAARLRCHALPRGRLIEPQVIGVLRTGVPVLIVYPGRPPSAISSSKLRGGSCHGSQSISRSGSRPRGA